MTLAKINGIAVASVAKVNGIAKASISKWYGQAFPSGAPSAKDTHTGGTSADVPLRYNSSYEKISSDWVAGSSYTLTRIDVDMKKFGSPTGNITLDVYSASSGLPTGASLGTSTNTVDASTVSTASAGATYTFNFTGVSITNGSSYCMVWSGTYSLSTSNNIREVGGTVTSRKLGKYNGTSWSQDTANDQVNFTTYGT